MGTSGITHFHESDFASPVICHVYKQSDGYPDSLGEQIKACFGNANLVNGIRFDLENQVNGMGCAASQFIAYVKQGVGGVYMLREAPRWSDYDYHVFHDEAIPGPGGTPAKLRMTVMSGADVIWSGDIKDFDAETLYPDEDDEAS